MSFQIVSDSSSNVFSVPGANYTTVPMKVVAGDMEFIDTPELNLQGMVDYLKGFVKVQLQPGEEKEVRIALCDRSFAVWSIEEKDWVIEPGKYELRIGASSRDIRLRAEVIRAGAAVKNPYIGKAFAPYYSGDVNSVGDESFKALLGRDIPNAHWDRNAPMGFNDTISQAEYLDGGLGKFIYRLIALARRAMLALGKKELGNNVMFVMNLPWRGMARMSGFISDEQMMALLAVINRKKGGWRRLISVLSKKNK